MNLKSTGDKLLLHAAESEAFLKEISPLMSQTPKILEKVLAAGNSFVDSMREAGYDYKRAAKPRRKIVVKG